MVDMSMWEGESIDITGKDKAAVLAALYNGCVGCRRTMSPKEAAQILTDNPRMVATIDGLEIKVDFRQDKIWTVLYDRAHGRGAMRSVLEKAGII